MLAPISTVLKIGDSEQAGSNSNPSPGSNSFIRSSLVKFHSQHNLKNKASYHTSSSSGENKDQSTPAGLDPLPFREAGLRSLGKIGVS